MSPSRSTWKKAESRAAKLLGAKRQVLSGSSGREDRSSSDSTHPEIFLETKHRSRTAIRSLHDKIKPRAVKERKVPFISQADKGRPGFMYSFHSDDLERLIVIWARERGWTPPAGGRP